MGYTALLFCPDEKTARTVTQVLSELEFTVEACIEPFAAVKKLMGQHFDAVVVDCDNEQNATLLFKSARNSTSNQTSLAVAVVEGQAGVAKAFRIGANLVLTKPINIEQSKGTLRVARGLLRKSEPAKPAAPGGAAPSAGAASKADVATPVQQTTTAPPATSQVFAAQPAQVPQMKPTPAWSAAAVASSQPASQDDDLLSVDEDEKSVKPATASVAASPRAESLPNQTTTSGANPMLSGWQSPNTGGAASAPAPAREAKPAAKAPISDPDDDVLESATDLAHSKPSPIVGSAPSFTFGAAEAEAESGGAGKKILIGIAAAAIVSVGLYFGWTRFHGSPEEPVQSQTAATSAPTSSSAPTKSAPAAKPGAIETPAKSVPAPVPSTEATKPAPGNEKPVAERAEKDSGEPDDAAKSSTSSSKPSAEDTPEAAPMRVKGGKTPAQKKSAVADAAAPSVIGMSSGEIAPPPTFVSNENAFKPALQTLNVSQGVSQGLLIKKVPPSYPASAFRQRIEGKVELLATISKNGDIAHIQVISGDSQLTKAATDAVKQWKYKPYLLNGEPVEIQTQVTVNFRLPQ